MGKANSVELSSNELFQNDLVIWYTQGNKCCLFSSNPIIELYIVQSYCLSGTDGSPDTKTLVVEIAAKDERVIPNTVYAALSVKIKTGDTESLKHYNATLTSGQNSWEIKYYASDSFVFTGEAYFECGDSGSPQIDFTDGEAFYTFAESSFEQGAKPTQKTTIASMNYIDYLANNILEDFANGVKEATITLACSDYYDENGEKVKQWQKGDIVDLGDLLLIYPRQDKKESFLGRVTGRTFKYEGCPFVDLTLQEIKRTALTAPMIAISGNILTWFAVKNATQYYIYDNSKLLSTLSAANETALSVNLESIVDDFKEHKLYVIASASNYSNSPKSNIVSYTKYNVIDNGDGTITILNASVKEDGSVLVVGEV